MIKSNDSPHLTGEAWPWTSPAQRSPSLGQPSDEPSASKPIESDVLVGMGSNDSNDSNDPEPLNERHPALRHSAAGPQLMPHKYSASEIAIPEPHLPLRKHASQTLRSRAARTSQSQEEMEDTAGGTTMGTMAQKLRLQTDRWSHDSSSQENSDFFPSGEDPPSLIRSSTPASDSIILETGLANGEDATTASQKSSPARTYHSASSKGSATFWRDGGAQSLRESIMTTVTAATTAPSEARTSSIWTSRSSHTKYESEFSDWQMISDDEFSVEDCIAMYASLPDGPRSYGASKADDIPPVPPITIPTPLLRTTDAPSSLSSPPPLTGRSDPSPSLSTGSAARPSRAESTTTVGSDGVRDSSKQSTPVTPVATGSPADLAARGQCRIRVPRDVYGFKQESQHVTQNQYNAWYKDYKGHLARRKKKWIFLMNTHGLKSDMFPDTFPPPSNEVKRYVRKGIPPEWRGAAWFFYGDGASFLTANPGLYDRLVKEAADGSVSEHYRDIIERDLHRTFPDNVSFKPDAVPLAESASSARHETEMIKSLRRVLQAYAVYRPKVGYCQSLNFIAGHLLLFMRLSFRNTNYEERAFALLCILTEKYLPGTHSIVLEGCDVDIGVLMTILQETMPAVFAKLDDSHGSRSANGRHLSTRASVTLRTTAEALPDVSLATTAWFMSCFVSTLPIESTCRVWDCLWYEGSKTIFRVALTIFKLGEKSIRRAADGSEVFQIVQTLPKGLLDANELMKIATMKTGKGVMERLGAGTPGFGGLSQKTVEGRREERRAFAKAANEAKGGEKDSMGADSDAMPSPSLSASPMSPQDGLGTGLKRSRTRGTLERLKSMRKVAAT